MRHYGNGILVPIFDLIQSPYEILNNYHKLSIAKPDEFWEAQAKLINWFKYPENIYDYTNPPYCDWFADGKINLCMNAVDRHLAERGKQKAIIFKSSETNEEETYSYNQLYHRIQIFAKILIRQKVQRGDRVIIYMPMIPEAIYVMLACVRIGAIHSVVFGGFSANALAIRIKDANPTLIVTCDAGLRNGRVINYKEISDQAQLQIDAERVRTLIVDRKLASFDNVESDITIERNKVPQDLDDNTIACVEMNSTEPSYILYTSGTTGSPKGIQRDTGGYAVALAASMRLIYGCRPGEVFFCASDIGWVVGHSYLVYGPLINGCTTVLYEGLPTKPHSNIWWEIVEKYSVSVMFTSPTAIRILKKEKSHNEKQFKTESLRSLFLAGEPLDTGTISWVNEKLPSVTVIDNYWQTETGWPILSAQLEIQKTEIKPGSPSFPVFGYDLALANDHKLINETEKKGMLCLKAPLPPGSLQTIWGNDNRFINTYFFKNNTSYFYKTFDFAEIDNEGYYYMLGRTDDVINVAGHRIGTRELEEALQLHERVAETAVIGVQDKIKGQVPLAFIVKKEIADLSENDDNTLREELDALITEELGRFAKPKQMYFVPNLPKTRSGKLLRRALQAICEGRDPGDLTTIEDNNVLEPIKKIFNC